MDFLLHCEQGTYALCDDDGRTFTKIIALWQLQNMACRAEHEYMTC